MEVAVDGSLYKLGSMHGTRRQARSPLFQGLGDQLILLGTGHATQLTTVPGCTQTWKRTSASLARPATGSRRPHAPWLQASTPRAFRTPVRYRVGHTWDMQTEPCGAGEGPPADLRVVAPFVTDGSRFYFQRRSNDAARGAAGLLGTFGGKVEPGEADRDAAVRELAEETDLEVRPQEVHYLGEYEVASDHRLRAVRVHIVAFEVRLPENSDGLRAREGELVVLGGTEVASHLEEMSPGTREGWQRYFAGHHKPE